MKTHADTPKPLTMEIYKSAAYDANLEKFGGHTDQCICCGRMLKPTDNLWIHMSTDCVAVDPDRVTEANCKELTGAESQGCFRIGSDCAKKMKGFTFKMPEI